MGRGKLLTEKEKGLIEAYKQSGLSIRGIGRKINRSEKSVRNFLNGMSGNTSKRKKVKNCKFSKRICRKIIRDASNSTLSVRKMAAATNVKINSS